MSVYPMGRPIVATQPHRRTEVLRVSRFLRDALERILATTALSVIAVIGAAETVSDVNWRVVAGTAALVAVLTTLKTIVARGFGDPDSASMVSLDR